MPVFLVTYTSNRTDDITYETEWITPGGYDDAKARSSFEGQFPSAAVVRIDEVVPEGSAAAAH